MIIDSHCHLDDRSFDQDRDEVLARAKQAGVGALLSIGTGSGPPDLEAAIRISDANDSIYATVGVHPHDAEKANDQTFSDLEDLLGRPKVLALGEIGLDYHYDNSPRERQRDVFVRQMGIARTAGKPIAIHTRDAWEDTLALLDEYWVSSGLGCVLHCFSGNEQQADAAVERGFYCSYAGVLTFARADDVRAGAARVPLDRVLVETDAPYLTPAPFRKVRRNEPFYVIHTAKRLAELKRMTYEELAAQTTRNFCDLFGLPVSAFRV
ncbi:MAG: TatD family hydrolase [Acidobacteria bacterium]|nr:TatD family hydrolase [Acidobacteriota bacterium]